MYDAVERFRRNGTWFVPTLTVSGGSPLIQYFMHAVAPAFWAGSPLHGNWLRERVGSPADSSGDMVAARRFGLPILAGTDVSPAFMRTRPPGFALHAELATYVAGGMTTLEALRAATLNPAKMLHGTDSLGTVAVGKLADLVL